MRINNQRLSFTGFLYVCSTGALGFSAPPPISSSHSYYSYQRGTPSSNHHGVIPVSQKIHDHQGRIFRRLILAQNRYNGIEGYGGDDDDDDDDHDDDDDYDDVPEVDAANFKPPSKVVSFGTGGRSSPSTRKAMGTSGTGSTLVHVCTNCGCETVKWMGRCPTCREWNTLQEFQVQRERKAAGFRRPIFGGGETAAMNRMKPTSSWVGTASGNNGFGGDNNYGFNKPVRITDVFDKDDKEASKRQRIPIPDDDEMQTVLGGGIMKGSLTLLGGTPGVGKSTLLLQTAASVASLASSKILSGPGPVWYCSGEETQEQIASRAQRLGLNEPELWLLSETHVDSLVEQVVTLVEAAAMNQSQALYKTQPPSLLVIDSIQTMICDAGGNSAAGGVTQMRECVALFLRLAKSTGIPIFLVGHVTKSGDVAGPRTIEHMVDSVCYLDGAGAGDIMNLRMLRASKNRFGSSEEVGVYEMTAGRLIPVSDPSSLLLSHRLNTDDSEGCAITVTVEGLRAMTVEIQTLCTSANPTAVCKRTVNGIAYNRLALLLGVINKRCGMYFGKQDVYVNVVGSVKLDQKGGGASDLAVAVALTSSLMSIPVRSDTAFVGEVGLLGEVRPVAAIEKRIQEARRMGFSRIITPVTYTKGQFNARSRQGGSTTITKEFGIERVQCSTLLAAINAGLVRELPKRRKRSANAEKFASAPNRLEDLSLDETIFDNQNEDDDESIYM